MQQSKSKECDSKESERTISDEEKLKSEEAVRMIEEEEELKSEKVSWEDFLGLKEKANPKPKTTPSQNLEAAREEGRLEEQMEDGLENNKINKPRERADKGLKQNKTTREIELRDAIILARRSGPTIQRSVILTLTLTRTLLKGRGQGCGGPWR